VGVVLLLDATGCSWTLLEAAGCHSTVRGIVQLVVVLLVLLVAVGL